MTPCCATLITLGRADLAASRAVSTRLGWKEHSKSRETGACFK